MDKLPQRDITLINGRFHTLDKRQPVVSTLLIRDGKFLEKGVTAETLQQHLHFQLTVSLLLSVSAAFMLVGLLTGPFGKETGTLATICGMSGAVAMGAHNAYTRLLQPHLAPPSMVPGNVTQIVLNLIELLLGEEETVTRARLSKSLWPHFIFAARAALARLCQLVAGFWGPLVPVSTLLRLPGNEHSCIIKIEQT